MIKKVCYFGIYKKDYSRHRILLKGLKYNGVEVVECYSGQKGIVKYFDLAWKFLKLKKDFDFVLVAFPGQQCVVLVRILTRKKIIFDAFVSLYDSLADDRKSIKKNSFKARYYWHLDKLSCRLADKIILDTNEHIKYFTKNFKIRPGKFIRLFVGSDINDFLKNYQETKNGKLEVIFYGSFIPLQGVDKIIKAAEILKDNKKIHFTIIGSKIKDNFEKKYSLRNIDYINNLSYQELAKRLAAADVCLGIFGDTDKANRVIPNKVYDGVALGKIVITKNSPAARELFKNGKNILLIESSPENITLALKKFLNRDLGIYGLKKNALNLYRTKLKPKILGLDLIKKINYEDN